jgi:phosphoribosyl 1,2-cyclic phosphate phosphodiesterase
MGVPMVGCSCPVCTSKDPRDQRMRPSVAITWAAAAPPDRASQHCVVVDTGPEFRVQALRAGIASVDAVLYTHAHADHILGFDDLRPLSFRHRPGTLPLYADDTTADTLERIFDYTFSPSSTYPNKARVQLHRIAGSAIVQVANAGFQRIPLLHGRLPIAGYRFGSAAYLTDMSTIPDESIALLQNLDVVILDALRWEHHPSHANIDEATAWVEKLGARQAFFTHMSHDLGHTATEARLPAHIRLLYDGQQIPFHLNTLSDTPADTPAQAPSA